MRNLTLKYDKESFRAVDSSHTISIYIGGFFCIMKAENKYKEPCFT